jgi:hypothetical protein
MEKNLSMILFSAYLDQIWAYSVQSSAQNLSQFLKRQFREKRCQSFAKESLEGSSRQFRSLQKYRKWINRRKFFCGMNSNLFFEIDKVTKFCNV